MNFFFLPVPFHSFKLIYVSFHSFYYMFLRLCILFYVKCSPFNPCLIKIYDLDRSCPINKRNCLIFQIANLRPLAFGVETKPCIIEREGIRQLRAVCRSKQQVYRAAACGWSVGLFFMCYWGDKQNDEISRHLPSGRGKNHWILLCVYQRGKYQQ